MRLACLMPMAMTPSDSSGRVRAWSATSSTTVVTSSETESSWPTRPGRNGTRTWERQSAPATPGKVVSAQSYRLGWALENAMSRSSFGPVVPVRASGSPWAAGAARP